MMARLSGLQRQVLSLHRSLLRAARSKPPDARWQMERFVSVEFRKYADVDRKNYVLIEHLLRRGHKQLETLRSSEGFSVIELCGKRMDIAMALRKGTAPEFETTGFVS